MATLSEQEREVVDRALRGPIDRQVPTRGAMVIAAVEAILTARLAKVAPSTGDTCSVCARPRESCERTPACLASDPTHAQIHYKDVEGNNGQRSQGV